MIYKYTDCVRDCEGYYNVKKAIKAGELFQIEKGIYSDQPMETQLAVIATKYPKAVFTMNSAFYYHGLTDDIPDKYFLATGKDAAKIRDKRVSQVFENSKHLMLGAEAVSVEGVSVSMYSKERMLIELLRSKSKLPNDYYKEIIQNYRRLIEGLDIQAIEEYMDALPKKKMIEKALRTEVF